MSQGNTQSDKSSSFSLQEIVEKASSLVKEQKLEQCRTVLEEALSSHFLEQTELVPIRERLVGSCLMLLATGTQNLRKREETQKLLSEQMAALESEAESNVRLQELQGWKEILSERYESALRHFEQIPR